MVKLRLNGDFIEVREGIKLSELLGELELPDTRIAVELNKDVVRRNDWGETVLRNEDVLEIVHFVGGG
ncbi:MAG: sulfur carrier protein ThiS [Pyrinomonadaceae bacterium]|nr:sulfur carrier protein ThiS [Pyrinomonadaceae bacterium]